MTITWSNTAPEALAGLRIATLTAFVRSSPCLACGRRPSEMCHVKSRGAQGECRWFNLIPLCHLHHIGIQHQSGWGTLIRKFPIVKTHLERLGWEVSEVFGRVLIFRGNPNG